MSLTQPPPPSQPQNGWTATKWLDTTGRVFAESPLNALSSAGLALSLFPKARVNRGVYPRPTHLLLFATAFAGSGAMAFQGYAVDSAATMASWSTLYLLVNGWRRTLLPAVRGLTRGGMRGSIRGIGPAAMGVKALFDCSVCGWYWSTTRRWEPDADGDSDGK